MKPFPHAIIAVTLLAAGAWGGWAIQSATGKTSTEERSGKPETRSTRHPARPSAPITDSSGSRHTLAALLSFQAAGGRAGDLHDGLGRMDVPALQSLILEQQTALAAEEEGDIAAHRELLNAALAELWSRSGTAAMEWAAGLPEKDQRGTITMGLLDAALADDPVSALPWMKKYQGEFGKGDTESRFFGTAMRASAARSADDVIRIFGEFQGANYANPLHNAGYPEDFDFAKLHAALSKKTDLSDAISAWASRDPEAAWAAITKRDSDAMTGAFQVSTPFTAYLLGVIATDGEISGIQTIMERLSKLPEGQRTIHLHGIDPLGTLSTEGAAALTTKLPGSEKVAYAASVVRASGDSPRSHAVLDTLPRADLIATLQQIRTNERSSPFAPTLTPDKIAALDTAMRDRYQFTAEEMAAVTKIAPQRSDFEPAEIYAPPGK
ncbi:hypothetical protein OVA24_14970 [Luteolibacter sp. SL250]|uniref:hypothetical protein n=1 Tax=Luteolibacter sp. SL250 TaxID=2995170 RepID=UPI002271B62E|nr:hypothetical protein [Luteolibacter sp. SL250]WAC18535.1 hypothetical protein OVA24_14970 [Luteolibacter sp. SL250]